MTVNITERLSPICSPWLEALLAHERAILPQPSSLRARALNRARALLNTSPTYALPRPSWSGWQRLVLGSVAGAGLLTSAAFLHIASSGTAPSIRNHPLAPPPARLDPASMKLETPPAPQPLGPALDETTSQAVAPAPSEPRADQPEANDLPLDELGMLERAQRLDAGGDFLAVLTLTAEHERLFPTGRLCEEREVLRLRALIGLKRGPEARRVVRKFRHDYPHSVLLPTLDGMLAAAR